MQKVIEKVADKMINLGKSDMNEPCPISIIDIEKWEWAQGVGLYGMYRAYQTTGNKKFLDFLINWFDKNIEAGVAHQNRNINTTAPMLTLAFLCEETGREDYKKLVKEWADEIISDFIRTDEMGFRHNTSQSETDGQLWVDTLFMTVLFLAKAGKVLNEKVFIEESKRQFLIHIKYLFDTKTGLFFHGWSFHRRDNFTGALWGRGNCWYTAGVVDFIEILELEDDFFKEHLINTLKAQANALKNHQDESGMWHTLICDPTSYLESSGTCGFAYGILKAAHKGYLDESFIPVARKAVDAIISRIDEDGTVNDCSYGTTLGDTLDYYKTIRKRPMTYGQALAILMLSEALKGE